MYAGKLVETGTVDDVFYRQRMPYTLGLLGSLPRPDQGAHQALTPIEGNPPSLVSLPPGCPFAPRCPLRIERCSEIEPGLVQHDDAHAAACHRSDEVERRRVAGRERVSARDPSLNPPLGRRAASAPPCCRFAIS